MDALIRIGTRNSQLAVWQASQVQQLLAQQGIRSELIPIASEGDIDLKTPLYEIGVQGIFTRSLDAALLNHKIDIAVHSLKDVPTLPAKGVVLAAVLKRGPVKDLLVYNDSLSFLDDRGSRAIIGTGSVRRKVQWLNRYPNHEIRNLRGNVNTRLKKAASSGWQGAIFAAAGLERTGLRPPHSIELDWMLPAPAQGAITIACREEDQEIKERCRLLDDPATALCTRLERDFLRTLLGGCSTPIGAYAYMENGTVKFKGNVFSGDGKEKLEIAKTVPAGNASGTGQEAAKELLKAGADKLVAGIRNAAG